MKMIVDAHHPGISDRYNEFVFVDTGDNIGMGGGGLQGAADVDSLGVIEVKLWHTEQRPCIGRPACTGCAVLERPTGAGKVAPKLPAAGVNNKKFFQVRWLRLLRGQCRDLL